MPWIKPIVATFEAVPPDDPYNRYMGSWNKLLNLLFPPSTPFSVSPQYSFPNNNMAADFTSWFEIKYYTHPVLIVVVTSSSALNVLTAREDADLFMRDRLRDYAGKFFHVCLPVVLSFIPKNQKLVPSLFCVVSAQWENGWRFTVWICATLKRHTFFLVLSRKTPE